MSLWNRSPNWNWWFSLFLSHTHPRTSSIALGCSSQQLLPMVGDVKCFSHMRIQVAARPTHGKWCCTASILVGLLQQNRAAVYRGRFLACNENILNIWLVFGFKIASFCIPFPTWKVLTPTLGSKGFLKFSGVCNGSVAELKSRWQRYQVLVAERQYGEGSP